MDNFTPYLTFEFDSFSFPVDYYEEYCAGKLISSGSLQMTILVKSYDNLILTHLIGNTIESKILSRFEFDTFITLHDRMQLTLFPKKTNVKDLTFDLLRSCIDYTRDQKDFTPIEPIVGHVFLENMNIVKIVFKMTNPERIIEFY